MTHVARRRADQLRHGMLFHELRHVKANHRALTAKQELGQTAGDFSFAYASGTKKQKRTDRPVRILQTRARTPNGARQRRDCRALRDDALVQLGFDPQKLARLCFFQRSYGNPGPARDHFFDIVAAHFRHD